MESTELRKSPEATEEVHGTGAHEGDTRADPAPGPVMFDTPIERAIPSIVRRIPSATTRHLVAAQAAAPGKDPAPIAPVPGPSRLPLTAFTALAGTGRPPAAVSRPEPIASPPATPPPASPAESAPLQLAPDEIDVAALHGLPPEDPAADGAPLQLAPDEIDIAALHGLPPEDPAADGAPLQLAPDDIDIAQIVADPTPEVGADVEPAPVTASEPPPNRRERAPSASTFGAGMLSAHKVRGRSASDAVGTDAPPASRPSSSFGAGMLQARKVRAKSDALPAPSDPSATPSTFGAGLLQQRKSRAPLVMMLIVAVAAIAVVFLTHH